MYPVTIPLNKWFECQKWLSHNYLFPGSAYKARQDTPSHVVISFYEQKNLHWFLEYWERKI